MNIGVTTSPNHLNIQGLLVKELIEEQANVSVIRRPKCPFRLKIVQSAETSFGNVSQTFPTVLFKIQMHSERDMFFHLLPSVLFKI